MTYSYYVVREGVLAMMCVGVWMWACLEWEDGAGVLTLWVSLRLRVSQCVSVYVPIYAMKVSVRVYVADSAATSLQ